MTTTRLPLLLLLAAALPAADTVDFSYAFATPHRITVGRPGASEKTLLDLEPGSLTVSWSYDDLRSTPLATFLTPRTRWKIRIQPALDGKPFPSSKWTRGERSLPMLDNVYEGSGASLRIESIGGRTAALFRLTVTNRDTQPHRIAVPAEVKGGWVQHNPSWAEPGVDPDTLVAGQSERADRVLLLGLGAPVITPGQVNTTLEWNLAPGASGTAWLVRPYTAYQADLPSLRKLDWPAEFAAGIAEWHALLARATKVELPDAAVQDAFYAGLTDFFIMREPLANGYVGGVPGTEGYRATNPAEPAVAAMAMDQLGLHAEAADALRVHIDMQEPDGNWNDPKGWAHHCWGAAGFKAWTAMEHYRLTGDRAYLEALYPHLAANSRWQESRRRATRLLVDGKRTATYGLMPRGMGDGGLMNGKDYFGVFYTHNILAIYADKIAAEAAAILGRQADQTELRRNFETALADLKASLELGAIREQDFRWIPGVPNLTSGSRWGALYALFPAGLLDKDDPLITGTIRKIEQSVSAGGQPINTGWMSDGAWVAVTLDNLAEAHLVRGDADKGVRYLYSTLNHATPLYSWCEERGQEPGTKKISGDRQHLWTPLAVVRYLRDSLVMEQGTELHLALATARPWLAPGKTVAVSKASTHFGDVSYRLTGTAGAIRATVEPPARQQPSRLVLHLRHPERAPLRGVTIDGKPWTDFDAARELVRLPAGRSRMEVVASY